MLALLFAALLSSPLPSAHHLGPDTAKASPAHIQYARLASDNVGKQAARETPGKRGKMPVEFGDGAVLPSWSLSVPVRTSALPAPPPRAAPTADASPHAYRARAPPAR